MWPFTLSSKDEEEIRISQSSPSVYDGDSVKKWIMLLFAGILSGCLTQHIAFWEIAKYLFPISIGLLFVNAWLSARNKKG